MNMIDIKIEMQKITKNSQEFSSQYFPNLFWGMDRIANNFHSCAHQFTRTLLDYCIGNSSLEPKISSLFYCCVELGTLLSSTDGLSL